MGFNLFSPGWKSPNAAKRLLAVKKLNEFDKLVPIVVNSVYDDTWQMAIEQFKDDEELFQLLINIFPNAIQSQKLSLYATTFEQGIPRMKYIVDRINKESVLERVVVESLTMFHDLALVALAKIKEEKTLVSLLSQRIDSNLYQDVLSRIDDPCLLLTVIKNQEHPHLKALVKQKLENFLNSGTIDWEKFETMLLKYKTAAIEIRREYIPKLPAERITIGIIKDFWNSIGHYYSQVKIILDKLVQAGWETTKSVSAKKCPYCENGKIQDSDFFYDCGSCKEGIIQERHEYWKKEASSFTIQVNPNDQRCEIVF